MQHIGGLNVRRHLKKAHEFRQIIKSRESGFCAVSCTSWVKLNRGNAFPEGRCPAVKVEQAFLFQQTSLQVAHHDVHFRHGVRNRCAGRKHDTMPTGHLIKIHTLHQHITAFLAFCLGNARNIAHFGGNHGVFEIMCLIHHQAVHAHILKGDDVILALLVVEPVQLFLELLPCPLHLFDGEILSTRAFQKCDLVNDVINLPLQVHMLAFCRKRDFLELTVPDNDDVIVAGRNAGAEFLAVFLFEIGFLCYQNFRVRIEQERFGCHLLGQMVGNNDQRFTAKPQSFLLHGTGHHFIRLARAHFVRQQDIVTVQHMGNGVQLVRAKGDFRVHARKFQVTAIVLAGTQRVKFFIVDGDQSLAAFRLLENPVLELLTNLALLFLCSLRRLLIQHPRNASVSRRNFIPNLGRTQVQGVLRNQVGVGAVRTVGHRCFDIAVTKFLVGNGPAAGIRSEFHFDHPPRVVGGIQQFLQKLLHILCGNPSSAKADANFTGFQVLGLYFFKCCHIDLKLGIIRRHRFCCLQLFADIT